MFFFLVLFIVILWNWIIHCDTKFDSFCNVTSMIYTSWAYFTCQEHWVTLVEQNSEAVLEWATCVSGNKLILSYLRDVKVSYHVCLAVSYNWIDVEEIVAFFFFLNVSFTLWLPCLCKIVYHTCSKVLYAHTLFFKLFYRHCWKIWWTAAGCVPFSWCSSASNADSSTEEKKWQLVVKNCYYRGVQ